MDAATGSVRVIAEMLLDADQVLGLAGAIGIEAEDHSFGTVELVESLGGFVHAEFAGQANSGVFVGKSRVMAEGEMQERVGMGINPMGGRVDRNLVLALD